MTDALVVLVTAPAEQKAVEMARALVDERLAACVNVLSGVRSIYRWKGEVCEDPEVLLVVKTTTARLEAMRSRVLAMHPYENPEVLALRVEAGSEAYLSWLAAESAPG